MFQAKWNTDLTICCQDKEFHVHKIILGMQSEFFRKACDPDSPFKEARTGVITLPEDDAFLVRIMLGYCYTGNLIESCIDDWCKKADRDTMWEDDALCTIRIYSLADKYQIASLKKAASERFQLYLEDWVWEVCDFDDFPGLVREVYQTTPSTDRGLRDLVLFFISTHAPGNGYDFLKDQRFKVKMEKVQGFWKELLFYEAEICERKRDCPNKECGKPSTKSFPNWTIRRARWQICLNLQCPHCSRYYSAEKWNTMPDLDDNQSGYKDSSDEEEAPESSNKRKRLEGSPELGTSPHAAKSRRLQVCDGI
ncbi:hypothetical protein IWX90DRAFT_410387 [Phyllosticta citrichinensis]|uniref:BTB domain-containing protein n=1 Tax=Phyllosticta citrichinensis TaxID=1130410 RepID=A0ABR1Y5J3_9PEZI